MRPLCLLALAVSALLIADALALPRRPRPRVHRNDAVWSQGCLTEKYYTQRLDHFHWVRDAAEQPTFAQRYFVWWVAAWARENEGGASWNQKASVGV